MFPLGSPDAVTRLLAHAERATALLERTQAVNGPEELARVAERWEAGDQVAPELVYRPAPDLSPLLGALDQVMALSSAKDELTVLHAARARELWHEARIVAALGTPELPLWAAERFPWDTTSHGLAADDEARRWAALRAEDLGAPRFDADDETVPSSLVRQLQALIGQLRIPVRVVTRHALSSAAATGDGVIVVRSGVAHSARKSRRIALHEVLGHALPRVHAREEPLGIFAVGTAGGPDDEEGRALLIEERHQLLDDDRKRELGARHLAAVAVRQGQGWVDVARLLLSFGWEPREAVAIVGRVYRGGGLGRELAYLPALARIREAFARDPSVEDWMERGRIGVAAVPVLRRIDGAERNVVPRRPASAAAE